MDRKRARPCYNRESGSEKKLRYSWWVNQNWSCLFYALLVEPIDWAWQWCNCVTQCGDIEIAGTSAGLTHVIWTVKSRGSFLSICSDSFQFHIFFSRSIGLGPSDFRVSLGLCVFVMLGRDSASLNQIQMNINLGVFVLGSSKLGRVGLFRCCSLHRL